MQVLSNKYNFLNISPDKVLNNVIKSWVLIALIGQWMFAFYIISLYLLPSIFGNAELTNTLSPGQAIKSEQAINPVFYIHVLPAALMALSGLFQLFPKIRNNYPKLHRYNGRLFFILGLSGAFTGIYLTWGAGFRLSDIGSIGITLNGILIPIAIFFAWRSAINKQFLIHQRFAVHSFLLVNGVWSFRLYLMGWYIINQGSNGNTDTLDGYADIAISFACYLLPMAIAECIFWAKRNRSKSIKWFVSGIAALGTLITLIGVIAATMFMWTPRITQVLERLF